MRVMHDIDKTDHSDRGKPCPQIPLCDIQINMHVHVLHTISYHSKPEYSTKAFEGHSRSNVMVPLDSSYMVLY